jgi:hypothetical protein
VYGRGGKGNERVSEKLLRADGAVNLRRSRFGLAEDVGDAFSILGFGARVLKHGARSDGGTRRRSTTLAVEEKESQLNGAGGRKGRTHA